jgi:hypothetical protein
MTSEFCKIELKPWIYSLVVDDRRGLSPAYHRVSIDGEVPTINVSIVENVGISLNRHNQGSAENKPATGRSDARTLGR